MSAIKFQLDVNHGLRHPQITGLVYVDVMCVDAGDSARYPGKFGGYVTEEVATMLVAAPAYADCVARLDVALRDLLQAIDGETSNRDGEHCIPPSTGCIKCTQGTVPNDQNTGLCAYHSALKLAGRFL